MNLRRLWNNRKYMVRWLLVDTWQVWSTVLPVCLGAWALQARSEFYLKLLGLGLQLAGVCIAALAVLGIMRLFELDTLRKRISKWWARRPFATQYLKPGSLVGGSTVTSPCVSQGIRPIAPTDALSEQVATLVKNQLAMHENAVALQGHVSELEQRLSHTLRSEKDARHEQVEEVKKLMRKATVGSPTVALLGLYWIALGLVMATVPQELLCWCGW